MRGVSEVVAARRQAAAATRTSGSHRRLLAVGVLLALAVLLFGAGSAEAAPPSTTMGSVSEVSYTSAHVTGQVDAGGSAFWAFQYSTDGVDWVSTNAESSTSSSPESVAATLAGLKGGTTYKVRLVANATPDFSAPEAISPGPDPEFQTLVVTPPTVSIEPAGSVAGTTAHFSGHVTAGNADPAFDSFCTFDYVTDEQFQLEGFAVREEISCVPNPVTGTGSTAVGADAAGLLPNTVYHLRIRAENQAPGGPVTAVAPTFQTEAIAPTISATTAQEISGTGAVLRGRVDPGGSSTTVHFEYMSRAAWEAAGRSMAGAKSTPDSSPIGADNQTYTVTAAIGGLTPETPYVFRLVATNAMSAPGGTAGPVRAFQTEVTTADSCLNAPVRAQQEATFLPECRAWEIVSPLEKGGSEAGDPHGEPHYALASPDGQSILYGVFGPIETPRRGLQEFALGHRVADGWSNENPLPDGKEATERLFALTHVPEFLIPNENLTRYVFGTRGSRIPEIPTDSTSPNGGALYRTGPGDSLEWVTRPAIPNPSPLPGEMELGGYVAAGAASDLSRVYFWSPAILTPEDSAREGAPGWGLFEWSDEGLKNAGLLPDGTESPYGAMPAGNMLTGPLKLLFNQSFVSADYLRGQVSKDGKSLLFVSPEPDVGPEPTQLYLRRDGHSVLVSHLENGSKAPDGVVPVGGLDFGLQSGATQFAFGSPDGMSAIFQTVDALTADAPANGALKTYRYEVATDTVSYLPGVDGGSVMTSSEDGKRFLFGSSTGASVWDHGTIRPVFSNPAGPGLLSPAQSNPSGSVFLFQSTTPIDGAHTGGTTQLFRYDVAKETVDCLSCGPDDLPSGEVGRASYTLADALVQNHMASADGKVFFDTPNRLLPQDINNVRDVYMWKEGRLYLLTSGKGDEDSFYLDTSSSGNDVFIATGNVLLAKDTDGVPDVYDVRVQGGFLEEKPVFCESEACRGAVSSPPGSSTAATASFVGAGNSKPRGKGTGGAKVKVGARRLVGDSLKLSVSVPGAGQVKVSGQGVKRTQKAYSKAGTYQLWVPLSQASVKTLDRKGKVQVKVELRFKPKAKESASTVNFVLNLKA